MSTFPPFQARPLDDSGTDEAIALAAALGAHGIYLANALDAAQGEAIGLWGRDALLGCLWFGPRGNLIVLEREPLAPVQVADAVHRSYWPWRIALGPGPCVDELARRLSGPPLVHRDQVYHGCTPDAVAGALAAADARRASRTDRDRLMLATLELNRTDLNVDPRRVDRRWLRDMIAERVRDGTAWVLGPPGAFHSKVDLGSAGRAGIVLEGVFTFPEARGRGHAAALVAAVAASVPNGAMACLHVAADNAPARRAYERAGLRELERFRLLLAN
ncbi:MAG: GNAT family N-acetyltransferase [Planctomycetota bacterium]